MFDAGNKTAFNPFPDGLHELAVDELRNLCEELMTVIDQLYLPDPCHKVNCRQGIQIIGNKERWPGCKKQLEKKADIKKKIEQRPLSKNHPEATHPETFAFNIRTRF